VNKKERAPRKEFNHAVEFIVNQDIIKAESVNISQTGIRFETEEPVQVIMRIKKDSGEQEEHSAQLAWAQKTATGGTSFGLQFLDGDIPRDL
jgi:hypothetical protein